MQLNELALEEAKLTALKKTVEDRLKDVRGAMQRELDGQGVRTVDATLPDGTKVGTISRSTPKPKAEITDPAAFLAWVRDRTRGSEVRSRVVTEVQPAYEAKLIAEMTKGGKAEVADTETGEIVTVPGVTVAAPRSTTHRVLVTDEQIEAIAAAWRSGQLDAPDLPQLGTTEYPNDSKGAAQ